jgi:hypothetical protein
LTTLYGIQNLYDFTVYAVGGVRDSYNSVVNNKWKMTGSATGTNNSYLDVTLSTAYEGLVNNLPFSSGGYYTSNGNYIDTPELEIKINAYPLINITNNGLNVGEYTKCIYGNCSFSLGCHRYVDNGNRADKLEITNAPIRYDYQEYDYETNSYQERSGEFIPQGISITLDFDFVFSLNGDGIKFNPLNNTERSTLDNGENTIMCKIYNFLKTFNFKENIKNKKDVVGTSNIYPNHARLNAVISGVAKKSRGFNGYDVNDATLTKTTIL